MNFWFWCPFSAWDANTHLHRLNCSMLPPSGHQVHWQRRLTCIFSSGAATCAAGWWPACPFFPPTFPPFYKPPSISSPQQAAGSRWRCRSDPSPPQGPDARPVSPSPPSTGTCQSHPAWHCPAEAAGPLALRWGEHIDVEKKKKVQESDIGRLRMTVKRYKKIEVFNRGGDLKASRKEVRKWAKFKWKRELWILKQ